MDWRKIFTRGKWENSDPAHAPGHKRLGAPPEHEAASSKVTKPQKNQKWVRTSHSDSQKRRFRR